MKAGAGKIKGSAFEREVCKKLSLWISNGKNANILWRSAMSGGRSTLALHKGEENKEQAGDISAVSEAGHKLIDKVFIECKFYKDLGLDKFLLGEPSKLLTFWQEATKAARRHKKYPLLIAKQNFIKPLVIHDGQITVNLLLAKSSIRSSQLWHNIKNETWGIMISWLDDFLKTFIIKPDFKPYLKDLQDRKLDTEYDYGKIS